MRFLLSWLDAGKGSSLPSGARISETLLKNYRDLLDDTIIHQYKELRDDAVAEDTDDEPARDPEDPGAKPQKETQKDTGADQESVLSEDVDAALADPPQDPGDWKPGPVAMAWHWSYVHRQYIYSNATI